jgi:malate dehydrogenase (oxaloacetate-decarboxylating)
LCEDRGRIRPRIDAYQPLKEVRGCGWPVRPQPETYAETSSGPQCPRHSGFIEVEADGEGREPKLAPPCHGVRDEWLFLAGVGRPTGRLACRGGVDKGANGKMRQIVVSMLAPPLRSRRPQEPDAQETSARGMTVLTTPSLNKGTAFTLEERDALGLTGLLPPVISTLESQAASAFTQYTRLPDAISKNLYLTALHDRNEVLFYRLLSAHLREMIPIVNDRTVGMAMEQYHHECRRPRGVYLSIDHAGSIEEAFGNFQAGPTDIDLILATDAERIFGIGDWGVGGIEVAIGKLAIYTAAGGIDPARVMPVMLDVGTNRESLLANPMYPGNRHRRVVGERYDDFIDTYVRTATRLFPNAILQWEDFGPGNGHRILQKYCGEIRTFNDDFQGTGAVTLAALVSAMRTCGSLLEKQKVVVFGAGVVGIGIADMLRDVMTQAGLTAEEATQRFWCIDTHGLLTSDMGDKLLDYQAGYARPATEVRGWRSQTSGVDDVIGLAEVVRQIRPTILIGASGHAGAFTESIIRSMARHTEQPIVFPLSSPAPFAEATPADLIAWTDGRALIATGSEYLPVTWKGITHVIGEAKNAMLYPGLGLGTIVSGARLISVNMLAAAANALSSLVAVRIPGASLLPHIEDLRSVAATVAVAVAEAASADGLAAKRLDDVVRQVENAMWQPEYRHIQAT